ncbi:MAG: hypothetical protein IPM46_01950 [Flavobacteriales bacterium]|nr:hypothetical protein [Flavobacteriales bacterium]
MRIPFLLVALGFALQFHAQTAWLPLSREVERAYAPLMHHTGSTLHTAIRPYRRNEVRTLDPKDSVMAASALPALDRWAGVRNGRTFRWGPMLDLQGGFDADTTSEPIHRAGLGLWLEKDLGAKWSLHVDGMTWHERLPAYLDSFAVATQTVPGEGIGYLPVALEQSATYGHYDWSAYVSWDPGRYFNLTLGRGKNFFGEGHRS